MKPLEQRFSVVKQDDVKDIVFDYRPKNFPLEISPAASAFLSSQKEGATDFKISDLVSIQTGMTQLEKKDLEAKNEEIVLQRLKEIQEKAYQEAYNLGLEEGQKKASEDKRIEIDQRLNQLDGVLSLIENIKSRFLAENEKQLVDLLVRVAGKISLSEVKSDPQSIFRTLQLVAEDIQSSQEVRIYLSPGDLSLVETFRHEGGKKAEFLQHVKLEVKENLHSGGCLVETNFGLIDASMEQRVERMMTSLQERTPKLKVDQ